MNLKTRLWNARTLITRSETLAPVGAAALAGLSWLLRNVPQQRTITRLSEKKYLNAGCGRKIDRCFINLDFIWQPGVDLVFDLSRRLPFADGHFSGIYTEHCLEHLPLDLVTVHVLPEFFRVLSPSGCLHIIVPDGELYIRRYMDVKQGNRCDFPLADAKLCTPMMYVNRCFRDHGHLYAYDAETLEYFLRAAGFARVERASYMKGSDERLLLDSQERASESMYIEAFKQ